MKKSITRVLAGCLTVFFLAGCTSMREGQDPESWDDQQISQVIYQRLSDDIITSKAGFQVRTSGGVVSLYGYVPNMNAHARALAIAEASPGVVRVVDNITD